MQNRSIVQKKTLSDKLLELLEKKGVLTKEKTKEVRASQKRNKGAVGKILVEENIISYRDLMIFLSEQLSIPPIDLSKLQTASGYQIQKILHRLQQ